MITLQSYIQMYDNVISEELAEAIMQSTDFEPARDKGTAVMSYRRCYVKTLDKQFNKPIYEAFGKVLGLYLDGKDVDGMFGGKCQDTGYQHLLYKGSDRGEYKEHIDHFREEPRVVSCSIVLNDNYDGGNFSFFNNKYVVKKKARTALLFPSNWCYPHSITPVSNGDRQSLVTWFK